MKKMMEGKGIWEARKDILGWLFDGVTRCIELAQKEQTAILKEITPVLRIKSGAPFKCVGKIVGKLRHAAIDIPAGKLLFQPIKQMLDIKPCNIFWNR